MNREGLTFVSGVVYTNRTVKKPLSCLGKLTKFAAFRCSKGWNMALFKWKKEFSTCLADIDAQHKIFMKYINLCYDTVTRDRLHGVPPDLVKKLKKYVEIHFSYEEQMMGFYGFPELEKHQELHSPFKNEILKLEKSRLAGESTSTLINVLAMMRDWFLNHIIVEDRKLALYL